MQLDLKNISSPQLIAIKNILEHGIVATSEVTDQKPKEVEMEKIQELQEALTKKEAELAEVNTKLSEKDTRIAEMDKTVAELTAKVAEIEALTKEINDLKVELTALRQFKADSETAAKKAEQIKSITAKLTEAGFTTVDVEAEASYWLSMTDEVLTTTISKMKELKEQIVATSASIKVPPTVPGTEKNATTILAQGLNERKSIKR